MDTNARKLIKKIFYQYDMELITGLRIGDSKESTEIGGVDAPVVRRKDNQQPYIPGSSLKGKIRCLLELAFGINADNECRNTGHVVQKLFGASEFNKTYENKQEIPKTIHEENIKQDNGKFKLQMPNIPSRLIVRDSYLTNEWAEKLKNSEFTDMPYTEIKAENKINRLTGTAKDPRFIERVPAGAKFNVEFVINIFEGDDEKELTDLLEKGIQLLEMDYLGGSGSRGYGQVKFNTPKKFIQKIENKDNKLEIKVE